MTWWLLPRLLICVHAVIRRIPNQRQIEITRLSFCWAVAPRTKVEDSVIKSGREY